MRLMKGRSKDPTYHVIKDVRRDGKRSTEIVENLGHESEIRAKYNVTDADAWAEEYIKGLNEDEAAKDHSVLIKLNTDVPDCIGKGRSRKIHPYCQSGSGSGPARLRCRDY